MWADTPCNHLSEHDGIVQRLLDTVVVIDDSDTDLLFAQIMLERAGIAAQLLLFSDAAQALAHLAALDDAQGVAISLILLDINMPGLDGFGFLAAYQALPRRLAPVVMLSSSPDPADRVRALHHACVRWYVTKPLSLSDVCTWPERLAEAGTG